MECEIYLKWETAFWLMDRFAKQMERSGVIEFYISVNSVHVLSV